MFTSTDFLTGQSIDLKREIVELQPAKFPFSTLLLNKTVQANNPVVTWVTEAIDADAAVTLAEGGDAPAYVADDAKLLENNCELFGSTAVVSNTAQYSTSANYADLLQREVVKKMKALKMRIENILINGEKGFANSVYTMGGILEQIHADNKITNATFTKEKFEEVAEALYNAGVSDEMICFLPANMKAQINEFESLTYIARDSILGFDADVYATVYGNIHFVLTRNLEDTLFIVNPEYLELAELIPFHAIPQNPSGSKQSVYIETQLGVKLLNPKAAASFAVVAG